MNPRRLILLSTALLGTLCFSPSFVAAEVITINFDDLGAGTRTGTHYLNKGVMFFDSNGSRGTSTAIREVGGVPVTALVGPTGTSVSFPNVLVPSDASNNDIWVQFYESAVKRTTARFIQAQNDAEGFPTVALEAYDRNGLLLERTSLVGPSQFLSITNPNIYLAKFVSNPATPGNIGIDNVSFELSPIPEPATSVLMGAAGLCGIAWRLLRRRTLA
jgi:hypothetical protein